MCGIVGYSGHRQALPILLACLKRVEYRGYDSCGVALPTEQEVIAYKDLGYVETLQSKVNHLSGTTGIGHTRWATVGKPSRENAHPHLDCTNRIALVHNGDVDNFYPLKQQLLQTGHRFRSETDSEVIAHLIEDNYHGDLREAVVKATALLEGSYALAVVASGFPGFVVTRKESPLVLGVGQGESFAASDVPALLEYTREVIYLEDGQLAVLTPSAIEVWRDGTKAEPKVHQVSWSLQELDRAGYPHFMLKEIHEQPRVVRDTLAGRISLTQPKADLSLTLPHRPERLYLLACGTSYHAALIGEYLLSQLVPFPVQARVASEFEPGAASLSGSWAVALSQSGETTDTITATKKARTAGAWTLAITNVAESSLTRATDDVLYLQAGPEVSVAATKTFMSQLTALYLLALYLAPPLGRATELITELRTLPTKLQRVLNNENAIKMAAKRLTPYQNLFLIARGINYPVALEGALKIKEIAYLHAEGYPAGELKHGPFALLGPDTPVIALAPKDPTYPRLLTAIKEIKARGSPVIAVAFNDDTEIGRYVDEVLLVPAAHPLFTPWVNAVALQLLAYYLAVERGSPVDRPRHLAKSVTVP